MIVHAINGDKIQLEKADVMLLNPPFSRSQKISKERKQTLRKRFENYSEYSNGKLGLCSHFIFLASEFTKEGGKLGFVLPATILRVQSTLGIRRFLTQEFTLNHIILGCTRASFSERSQFREAIIIGTKLKPKMNNQCCITLTKKLPTSSEQANEIGEKLRKFAAENELRYADDAVVSEKVTQEKLLDNINNIYAIASASDSDLSAILSEIRKMGSEKLITIDELLRRKKGRINRFDYSPFKGAFVVQPSRASLKVAKNLDEWLIESIDNNSVVLANRFTNQSLKVPRECFALGLRRLWKIAKLDVSDESDLIVVEPFSGVEKVVKNQEGLGKCKHYVQQRQTNLMMARRFDISAPGTRILSFFSTTPIVGVDMWSVTGLTDEEAKITALWLNSSFSLAYNLMNRTETGGAWLRLDASTLRQIPTVNVEKLRAKEKKILLELFDLTSETGFPSILTQLQEGFTGRKRIDILFAQLLGYSEGESSQILERIYPALLKEILALRKLMYQSLRQP